MRPRKGNFIPPNPLLLVAIAAIAAAAQPVLGTLWLGVLLIIGFGLYGGLALRAGYRAVGSLFMVAAGAIALALLLQ